MDHEVAAAHQPGVEGVQDRAADLADLEGPESGLDRPADVPEVALPSGHVPTGCRHVLVEELGHGERSVAQLTRRVGISQPAVSRHLRLLKSAALVDDYPDGAKNIYRLRREGAEAVRKYVENLWGEAAFRFRLASDNTSPSKRR